MKGVRNIAAERVKSACLIESSSLVIEMTSCSYCTSQGRKCLVDRDVSVRCSECVRAGRSKCDALLPNMSEWDSIDKQRDRLEREEEEAMAKILRLRKQKKLLARREREMLKRGMRTLDELDAAEEKERLETEAREKAEEAAALVPSSVAGSSLEDLDSFGLSVDQLPWLLDIDGRILEPSLDNPRGS